MEKLDERIENSPVVQELKKKVAELELQLQEQPDKVIERLTEILRVWTLVGQGYSSGSGTMDI